MTHADAYANTVVRLYEDRTNLTAWFGGGSAKTATANMPEMLKCGVNLPVCDENDRLPGIATEADMLRLFEELLGKGKIR